MSLTPTGSPAAVSFGALPDGDYSPGTMQRERIQVQLEEFDIEVQSRLDGMRAEVNQLVSSLKKTFAIERLKIPKAIRKMRLKDFKEQYGCDITAVQKEAAERKVQDVVNMEMPTAPPSTARRSKRALKGTGPGTSTKRPKTDDGFAAPTPKTTQRKGRPAKTATATKAKPPTARRATRASSIRAVTVKEDEPEEAPRTVRRSTRNSIVIPEGEPPTTTRKSRVLKDRNGDSFKTPMPAKKGSKTATVAATPAFDPRLPYTPMAGGAARLPKRGESFMSLNGSPIAVGGGNSRTGGSKASSLSRSSFITLPVGGNNIVLDTAGSIEGIKSQLTLASLNKKGKKEAKDQLQLLMDQINQCMSAVNSM